MEDLISILFPLSLFGCKFLSTQFLENSIKKVWHADKNKSFLSFFHVDFFCPHPLSTLKNDAMCLDFIRYKLRRYAIFVTETEHAFPQFSLSVNLHVIVTNVNKNSSIWIQRCSSYLSALHIIATANVSHQTANLHETKYGFHCLITLH